jgi:mRNA interferase MazF
VAALRRGDVASAAGGVYASKPRPVIVIQDDLFSATDSVTVCPLTITSVDAPLLRMPLATDEATGIATPSFVMIDKITTVRRSNVGDVLGRLDAVQMLELERRVLMFLGLAG